MLYPPYPSPNPQSFFSKKNAEFKYSHYLQTEFHSYLGDYNKQKNNQSTVDEAGKCLRQPQKIKEVDVHHNSEEFQQGGTNSYKNYQQKHVDYNWKVSKDTTQIGLNT